MPARPTPARKPRPRPREAGFTLVELVIVLVLMGVISALAMARFADREPFAAQAVADQLVSGLRVSQAMAMAQRSVIYVAVASTPPTLSVCLDAACTQPLTTPAGDTLWLANTSGVHLNTAASFNFGADGVPSLASSLQLQVVGDGGTGASQLITVEAGSGYVH